MTTSNGRRASTCAYLGDCNILGPSHLNSSWVQFLKVGNFMRISVFQMKNLNITDQSEYAQMERITIEEGDILQVRYSVHICDPIYRNPVKHFDNINFDPLYLKNYSTNLLCFCLDKMKTFPISFQDKNKVNWLNSS